MTRYQRLVVATLTLVGGIIFLYGVYSLGQRSQKRITWFSELTERARGQKQYLIDAEIFCSNGKDIGKLQIDLNLANGKLRVVRDDSKLEPNCSK